LLSRSLGQDPTDSVELSCTRCGHFLSAPNVSFDDWAEQLIFCFRRSFSKERTTDETGISLTVGHYDSRGNYSPTPGPCIPLPPRNPERHAPPPVPYNGDFYSQPKRTIERETPTSTCHIGLKFIWDNGEGLGCDLPCVLTPASGEPIRTRLDEYSRFVGSIPDGPYQAQMLGDVDTEERVVRSRAEVQAALEAILDAERAEAAALQAVQDERGFVANAFYTYLAIGKGALYAAWGLVKSLKEYGDLINPVTYFSNVIVAAWNANASDGTGWITSFQNSFSAEQHRELIEAFGFDPSKINREQVAEAYELACFIAEDGPSKEMLARFVADYALAQNYEEVAEFGGGAVFEIVFAALLVLFTGGVGVVASARLLPLVQRLGQRLRGLGQSLRNARIKKAGRADGKGAGAQIVEVERPKQITPEPVTRQDVEAAFQKSKKARNAPPKPLVDEPHSIVERPGREGQYTTHYGDGTYKQYRGSGKEHGGIPRPNVKFNQLNVSPSGKNYPGGPQVRAVKPEEFPK